MAKFYNTDILPNTGIPMTLTIVLVLIFVLYLFLYGICFLLLSLPLRSREGEIVRIFEQKVSKIPAFIEVMRPHVVDESAFDRITTLHSEAMIRNLGGIYNLLEHNARIHDQFLFLMKLSVHIPELQKDSYFLYIRDFIIGYDREMQSKFSLFNVCVLHWNKFIFIKNITIIGYMLPGRTMTQI